MPPSQNVTPACRALISLMTEHQDELSLNCGGLRDAAYDLYALLKPKGSVGLDPAFTWMAGLASEFVRRRKRLAAASPAALALLNEEALSGMARIRRDRLTPGGELPDLAGASDHQAAYRLLLGFLDAAFRGYYALFRETDFFPAPPAPDPAWFWQTVDGAPHPDPLGGPGHGACSPAVLASQPSGPAPAAPTHRAPSPSSPEIPAQPRAPRPSPQVQPSPSPAGTAPRLQVPPGPAGTAPQVQLPASPVGTSPAPARASGPTTPPRPHLARLARAQGDGPAVPPPPAPIQAPHPARPPVAAPPPAPPRARRSPETPRTPPDILGFSLPDWGKFVAGACLPEGTDPPADSFKARFDPDSGWCACALATAGAGHPLGRRHAGETAQGAVEFFLRKAGEPAAVAAFESDRELLKEWRRSFASDPEGTGGGGDSSWRRSFGVDGIVSGAFTELFRKAGPGCSALLFAGVKKLPVCWVVLTVRAGRGEAAVLGGMVPGGRHTGPLLSRGGTASGPPFADSSAARISSLARVSLPVAFDGIVLASGAAAALWCPQGTASGWAEWWEGPFRSAAGGLFDPASGLSERARSLAGALGLRGGGGGLSAAVVR